MATGPSTAQTPYLVASANTVTFTSILSAGDAVAGSTRTGGAPWRMVGVPDGLGAYDNGDGTFTVLMNHEIGGTAGVTRAHGSVGAFVSRLVVDSSTLQVRAASDLGQSVFLYNRGTGQYQQGTTQFSRLCSADLPAVSAFYDSATGLGTQNRIFMNGEEAGVEGRAFAWIATGSAAGQVYELPRLGHFSWENSVANPNSGARTVVVGTDDATPGQVYVYVGNRQATGNDIERAGLTNGSLYGIRVPAFALETNATAVAASGTPFLLQEMGPGGNVSNMTGAQLQAESSAEGVTEFLRPEDGAWDPSNPSRFYFVTTNNATSPSRLWALDFTDISRPELGGTVRMLLDGTEGQVMMDNITVTQDGRVVIQEDPGNNARLSRVYEYDPQTDQITQLAQHDPARFGTPPTAPFTQDEESSGVVDVTDILGRPGEQVFLLDVQAHYGFGDPEIVEGGQLLAMRRDRTLTGTAGADTLVGSQIADRILGGGGADSLDGGIGNDLIEGGAGDDTLVGGAGIDTAVFSGARSQYVVQTVGDGTLRVIDQRLGAPDGTDTLRGIEVLRFSDGAVDVSSGAAPGGSSSGGPSAPTPTGLTLAGTAGADLITGGPGNDTLAGLSGNDTLFGNEGADLLEGNQGADLLFGNQGSDTLFGGQDQDTLFGGQDADLLFGNLGADLLLGNLGMDTLYGGQGNDSLYGGQGDDVLFGDLGDDVLSGDLGNDVLRGGAGADRYVFGVNSGADVVLGFSAAEGDRLDLSGQTYRFGVAADGSGSALLVLSGGGTIELAGITQAQVNAGFFA